MRIVCQFAEGQTALVLQPLLQGGPKYCDQASAANQCITQCAGTLLMIAHCDHHIDAAFQQIVPP
ncbi:hypothetical protein D3C78_1566030 [compost metagenome]